MGVFGLFCSEFVVTIVGFAATGCECLVALWLDSYVTCFWWRGAAFALSVAWVLVFVV